MIRAAGIVLALALAAFLVLRDARGGAGSGAVDTSAATERGSV